MVEKIGEWDWEDQISEGFQQLVVQDNETGECWTVSPNETDCLATVEKPKGACSRMKNFKSCWKVPKEYSLLGCSKSAAQAEDTQPILSVSNKIYSTQKNGFHLVFILTRWIPSCKMEHQPGLVKMMTLLTKQPS